MHNIFDELNGERISIPYEEYFGEMDIDEKEKEDRTKLAKELEVLFLFLFMSYGRKNKKEILDIAKEQYKDIAMSFAGIEKESAYLSKYTKQIIDETIRVTDENIDKPYYTSWDRAMFIAENEANAIGNYRQQINAVKMGKKYKTWITMNDQKVRHTHEEINNLKIPIFETFQVGNSEMMFPKDESLGASADEIVNCRCTAIYS